MFRNAVLKHAKLAMDRGKFLPNAEKSKGLLGNWWPRTVEARNSRTSRAVIKIKAAPHTWSLPSHMPPPSGCRLYRTEMVYTDSAM